MNKIRFSHRYLKMPLGYNPSVLLEVIPIDLDNLSQEFRKYDVTTMEGGEYPLPESGKYMILLLLSMDTEHLWTTIRRFTPEKYKYYKRQTGNPFEIVISEGEKK